jgi:pyridoxine 5-phosphate synthase
MPLLGVNIDHVATLRQARRGVDPDPVWAAVEAQLGGADIITAHLREDRRHINDDDIRRLRSVLQVPLNIEMAAVPDIRKIAIQTKPDMVTLVPEKRTEVTTEGGLDVQQQWMMLRSYIAPLKKNGILTSAFIDADVAQVRAAADAGFDICELHTGPYSLATGNRRAIEIDRLRLAAEAVVNHGMQLNAGHGLNFTNVTKVAALPHMAELHIGHSIISRSVFVGLREAVRLMRELIQI